PDAAVILIGANDVTHRVPVPVAVASLARTVRDLRAAGCGVVVGTCPDLGTVRPIQPPLRWLARRWSRELAAAQTVAVVEAAGTEVTAARIGGRDRGPAGRWVQLRHRVRQLTERRVDPAVPSTVE